MFENLISIESVLGLSVGALFSFKINRINLNLRNNTRNQSPDINGNNNLVIYNEIMAGVKKEISFSVKVCAFLMMIVFHMFPLFFLKLLLSLSFILPALAIFGYFNTIRFNGYRRGWDILYPVASVAMGVIFYCALEKMVPYLSLYPQLISLYEFSVNDGIRDVFSTPPGWLEIAFIVLSSFVCPLLILSGFYLSYAYTIARDGNEAFRYSRRLLAFGYAAYLVLAGAIIQPEKNSFDDLISILFYPFVSLYSLFSF